MTKRFLQSGISLVEVIVAIGIIAAMLVTVGFAITNYIDARAALLDNTKAIYLAEEGYEILRAIRDTDWNEIDQLSTDTYYYFAVSTSSIGTTTSPEIIDSNYRRSFVLRDLYRDTDDDIVASTTAGASVDTNGREVEIFVSGPNGTTSLNAIITNMFAI